ncbi:GFA family protein [Catenovulum sp. 2E275]|uniref:GFA family protein n=1 Tax=Catenovulum sp. 2E275 TaxID=2980497 RepID=UPI0021D14B7F|nr:GFA family protein [Catenovulum sp. 2E275]MCU4677729.1 GFA family protein [Catenovulum sp. 2E275]
MIYIGSCLCGDVSFEVKGEIENLYLCHCKYCQKDTGSAYASNLFSTKAKLIWQTGENKVKTYQLPSTQHVKSFCSNCGSAVPSMQMNNELVVVPAGCLNQDIAIKPTAHIYKSSEAVWAKNLDKVKSYEQLPE